MNAETLVCRGIFIELLEAALKVSTNIVYFLNLFHENYMNMRKKTFAVFVAIFAFLFFAIPSRNVFAAKSPSLRIT